METTILDQSAVTSPADGAELTDRPWRPGAARWWPLGAVAAPWEYATAAQGQSGTSRIPERYELNNCVETRNEPLLV